MRSRAQGRIWEFLTRLYGRMSAKDAPATEDTWQQRLTALLGPRGYQNNMRRSLQTIVLYEAKRSLEQRPKSLRPYQRKIAFLQQAQYILDTLDFLFPKQRAEILYRTLTSRTKLDGDTAWARLKGISKELSTLANQAQPHLAGASSQTEAVDHMVQAMYVS